MPIWALNLLGFLGKRSLHFIVYAAIAALAWGIYNKIFVDPTNTTNVASGGKIVNVYHGTESQERIPMFGCSAWRVQNEMYWKKSIKRPAN